MVQADNNLDEIRKLYPQMTDEELRVSQENLESYLQVLLRIAERLQQESKSINDVKE